MEEPKKEGEETMENVLSTWAFSKSLLKIKMIKKQSNCYSACGSGKRD